ncbi:MAG: PadR family transcriptional regulator [Clostridia bacterium]|nr:PadR family transcriptional regulator [Clostridia bacterium]
MLKPIKIEKRKKCPCQGENLDRFIQPIILAILSQGDLTGYQIIKRMEEYATYRDARPDPTGVYRYLKTMQSRGHILKVTLPDEGDKEKSLFSITEEGRDCLTNWVTTLKNYGASLLQLAEEVKPE